MGYRIGILGRDFSYIRRLVDFLESHHGDSLVVDWSEEGGSELDFDGDQYDAVFISGDLKPGDKKIPTGIKKVYLADKLSDRKEPQILKYQRLEEIYRQMLEICDKNEAKSKPQPAVDKTNDIKAIHFQGRFDGVKFSKEHIGKSVYSVLDFSDNGIGEPDELETGMLENNSIQGIAGLSRTGKKLRYDITDMRPLTDFISAHSDGEAKEGLIRICANILNAMLSLGEYMLDWRKVVLRPDEIFVHETTLDVSLLYYPFDMSEENETYDICGQLNEIIAICGQLLSVVENVHEEEGTEVFEELQKAADDSICDKKRTVELDGIGAVPYLIRKRTNEKIMINRNIFKLGKDMDYVDYCIRNNPTVSRNHADIVKKSDGFYAVDKGSLNHTFVNGKRLEKQQYVKLEKGDLLQIADEVFEFGFIQ